MSKQLVKQVYRNFINDFKPRRFGELVGQDHVVKILSGWIRDNRIPQAVVLTGDMGTGKTVIAELLVNAATCLSTGNERHEPCGQCDACAGKMRRSCNHIVGEGCTCDQFKVFLDSAVRNGPGMAWLYGQQPHWYAIWIDELHELHKSSQRYLRGQLDEGWHDTFVVATSSDPDKIDKALMDNRCVGIHLVPPSKQELAAWALGICGKAGIMVGDEAGIGRVIDMSACRFRGILTMLQTIRDIAGVVNNKSIDDAWKMSGKH